MFRIIGMVHLIPMLGYEDGQSPEELFKAAYADAEALIEGDVDALLIENNYNIPHHQENEAHVIVPMTLICNSIRAMTDKPLGICALWNDYKTALSIAKYCDMQFVRIPVFVDDIETHYGFRITEPFQEIVEYRKMLDAEHIEIWADIHVKHSTVHTTTDLAQTALRAQEAGADTVIITGKWTGDLPTHTDLEIVKNSVSIPVIIGSGIDEKNITQTMKVADGAIVGTSIKEGEKGTDSINVKKFSFRVDAEKVGTLMSHVRT